MPRKGRKLEQLVAMFEETLGPQGVVVKSPDYIKGRISGSLREIDISLRSQIGSAEILVIIECRDRKDTEDVTWIEQLATKREDVGADKAVAVSSSGFSSGAAGMANRKNIELRTYEEVNPNEIMLWLGFDNFIVFNHKADIKHVYLNLAHEEKGAIEFPNNIKSAITPIFDLNYRIFTRKVDGKPVSFQEIWRGCNTDKLYSNIEPDAKRIKFKVRFEFPNKDDCFQIITTTGQKDIDFFDVCCELWIETEKKSLSSIKIYREDDKIIAKSANFRFGHEGKGFEIGFHKIEESEDQFVTIHAQTDSE